MQIYPSSFLAQLRARPLSGLGMHFLEARMFCHFQLCLPGSRAVAVTFMAGHNGLRSLTLKDHPVGKQTNHRQLLWVCCSRALRCLNTPHARPERGCFPQADFQSPLYPGFSLSSRMPVLSASDSTSVKSC